MNKLPLALLIVAIAPLANAKTHHVKKPPVATSEKTVLLKQGEIGRWPDLAAKECAIDAKRYPAVDAVCYYPVDIRAKVGRHAITLWDQDGKQHKGWARVEAVDWPEVKLTLPNDTYINVSPDNQRRATKERAAVLALLKVKVTPARFSLPLGAPATPLPNYEDDFGSKRVFNDKVHSQHTGRDYPVPEGSPVKAIADGTVVLAEEYFLTGKTVFVDHGDGLVSEIFHLSELAVKPGDEVKRGDVLGKVGGTGRATGPHLHLGLRWVGQRVDPQPLLDNPLQLHDVGDSPIEVERKENATAEPKEKTPPNDDDEG